MKPSTKKIIKVSVFYVLVAYILGYILLQAFASEKTPKYYGYQHRQVLTKSMEPLIKQDEVIIIRYSRKSKLKVGDIITFHTYIMHEEKPYKLVVTHYLAEIYTHEGTTYYKTSDYLKYHDATTSYDVWVDSEGNNADLTYENIIGKYAFKIPLIGSVVSFFSRLTRDPFMFLLIVANVGVIVLLVKLLIKKPKEEHKDMKKESDEDEISS